MRGLVPVEVILARRLAPPVSDDGAADLAKCQNNQGRTHPTLLEFALGDRLCDLFDEGRIIGMRR
jgi:hypothetical protein